MSSSRRDEKKKEERRKERQLTSSSTDDSHLLSTSDREGKIVENRSSGLRVTSGQVLEDDVSRGWPGSRWLRLFLKGWLLRDSRREVVDDSFQGVRFDGKHVSDPHPPKDVTRERDRDVEKPSGRSSVGCSSGEVNLQRRESEVREGTIVEKGESNIYQIGG